MNGSKIEMITNGIDDINIQTTVAHGFDSYNKNENKSSNNRGTRINKPFKEQTIQFIRWLRKSYVTGIVIVIDILMNLFLCILNIIDTYFDKPEEMKPLLYIEFIVNCYLLISWMYECIVNLHTQRFMLPISLSILIITFIPLVYYVITEESIFHNWENHSHVYSLCFFRVLYLDCLLSEALVYFWVGENQKLFHIVDKISNTIVFLLSLLYFSASIFHLLEGFNPSNSFHQFHNCFYFCVVTIVTVGFGDMYPQTSLGRIYCTLYILAFFFIFPMRLGQIITALNQRTQSRLFYANKHVLYTGDSHLLPYFIPKIKSDMVALLPKFDYRVLSKRKYKRFFYNGDSQNEFDLHQSNSEKAKQVILTSDGNDQLTFLRCKTLFQICSCPIFVYIKKPDLFSVFKTLGAEVLCEEYVRLMLAGEMCVPHYIDVMRSLFSIKTRKSQINLLRNFKTPQYFIGKTGTEVEKIIMNELGCVIVGIMSGDRIEYFNCSKQLDAKDRIFIISSESKYQRIKEQKISSVINSDIFISEEEPTKIIKNQPQTFHKKKVMSSCIINKVTSSYHKLVVGYHRGVELILRKFRERNDDLLIIAVRDLKEIEADWKVLSNIENFFVIIGNLHEETFYEKLNIMKATTIMILPSDRLGKDESDVIIIATIVQSVIEKKKILLETENEVKMKLTPKIKIPIICEIEKQESERFVKDFATTFSNCYAPEMICNMVRYKFNNRVWLDFSTVTSDVSVVSVQVPPEMVNYPFQLIFEFMLEKNAKCLGILKQKHGKYHLYSKKNYLLQSNDILFCVVKQREIRTVNSKISHFSPSVSCSPSSFGLINRNINRLSQTKPVVINFKKDVEINPFDSSSSSSSE
ncbi:hypothetical protein ENUP19_0284G0084 [Entamoeba nuttalli]|uniref:Calcium-gated potassium channel protein, putative n=2 Tax=Entamoeba nuttalli TaxID=412467 RepID=K2HED6_ENTNP|nr:calcium-gated potassium channel protein, putative [Entamoeba nuttalli P19]EKE41099.1 calcium-gated potassium channel protein, putative [Entamoeba nuttalli P19]|eukprot:XP_008856560.1 calcium-gated potassium channel protein, putative [Entamoeba nuttalli P19]